MLKFETKKSVAKRLIQRLKAVKVTNAHLLYYSKLNDKRYTRVNNHDIVTTAITKDPINPETLS